MFLVKKSFDSLKSDFSGRKKKLIKILRTYIFLTTIIAYCYIVSGYFNCIWSINTKRSYWGNNQKRGKKALEILYDFSAKECLWIVLSTSFCLSCHWDVVQHQTIFIRCYAFTDEVPNKQLRNQKKNLFCYILVPGSSVPCTRPMGRW